jgi:hypothetical protein
VLLAYSLLLLVAAEAVRVVSNRLLVVQETVAVAGEFLMDGQYLQSMHLLVQAVLVVQVLLI